MGRRKRDMPDLTRRGVLAHTAGQRLAQACPGSWELFRSDHAALRTMLNDAELEAFHALLPATWWAGFSRGWAHATEQIGASS